MNIFGEAVAGRGRKNGVAVWTWSINRSKRGQAAALRRLATPCERGTAHELRAGWRYGASER